MQQTADACRQRPAMLLLVFGLLLFVISCGGDGGPTGSCPPDCGKSWTFMLYDAADLEDVYDPFEDFCVRMGSGADLNVLVFRDTRDDSAKIYYIDSRHMPVLKVSMGEVNTGRPETLAALLEYSKQNYPAERYILAFYGHGRGWVGACQDATDGNDYLTMEEMRAPIADAGGVDLVLFTGPCLMGAVESVYELRNCTEVYVGSEDLSYYCYWDYPMYDIARTLHDEPGIGTYDLAESIIEFIWEDRYRWDSFQWAGDLTMSAVRTDGAPFIL